MSSRPYNRDRRDAAMEHTRRRIIEAVVALHAERGAARTSYAMIAARADVAIPTVYKHFPDLHALFDGCTAHVAAQAPPLGSEAFAALPDVPARVDALARVLFGRYRFMAPWLRWGVAEALIIPELAPHMRAMDTAQRALIVEALAPGFGPTPSPVLVALLDTLLGFASWDRMIAAGLSDADAADAVSAAARAILTGFAPALPNHRQSSEQRTAP